MIQVKGDAKLKKGVKQRRNTRKNLKHRQFKCLKRCRHLDSYKIEFMVCKKMFLGRAPGVLPGAPGSTGARREQKIDPSRSRPKLHGSTRKDEINSSKRLLAPGEPVLRRYRGFLRRPHPTQFFQGFRAPGVLPLPPEQMII